MKFMDEFRDPALVHRLAQELKRATTRPWTLMEVCGGQTHSIVKNGLDRLLPEGVALVHGPGCPVCVTPGGIIDQALALAETPRVILASFGDMLRVPGNRGNLWSIKAAGGDVRVVYSPTDALALARANPDREVVFFGVGFETTAPAVAQAVLEAAQEKRTNFSVLAAHVLVPPALVALLESPDNRVQGFLAAGHVCAVMGYEEYEPLSARYRVPIVVTGFEPTDILEGVLMTVRQLEEGRHEVENQYARAVRREGSRAAQTLVADVFQRTDRAWRGLGEIPASGLELAPRFASFDAAKKFALKETAANESPLCESGAVLRGLLRPSECKAFANPCTPENPLGAPMVSSEGACAAYYRYRLAGAS